MNYQEFVCAVEKEMNMLLAGGVRADLYTAVKNNGRERKGIMIMMPGNNVHPTIYLEEFYERFQRGITVDEIVRQLVHFYEKVKCKDTWDFGGIEHYEQIREKIVFKLIHTEKNKKLLKKIPHTKFLDMSIVYYVLLHVEKEGEGAATMLIHNEHLRYWDVEEKELFPVACENAKRLLPAQLFTMKQTLGNIMSQTPVKGINLLDVESQSCKDNMYVLSNPSGYFGAACMAYPGVLEAAGKVLGGDYYILPSSVHEVVLVPREKAMEQYVMDQMVKEINETQVAEEEVLSDHAYFYETGEKRLVLHQFVAC